MRNTTTIVLLIGASLGSALLVPTVTGGRVPAGYMILGETDQVPPAYEAAGTLPTTAAWLTRQPSLSPHRGRAVSALDGLLYAASGFSVDVEAFDPRTDIWTPLAPLPLVSKEPTVATTGFLFLFDDEVHRYDPIADQWVTLGAAPNPRDSKAASTIGGRVFVVGGNVASSPFEEYHPDTDSWTTRAPTAFEHVGAAAASVDGKLYVVGGWQSFGVTECYDPLGNSWTTVATCPLKDRLVGAALNGKVYVFDDETSRAAVYDPTSDSWVLGPEGVHQSADFGAAALGNRIFLIGDETTTHGRELSEYVPTGTYRLFRKL